MATRLLHGAPTSTPAPARYAVRCRYERDELIAALHQLMAFTEGLLTLSERLVRAYDTDARPIVEELAAMRDGLVRWREQLEGFDSGSRRQPPSATDHYHSSSGVGEPRRL
jgi:hypothetical protein